MSDPAARSRGQHRRARQWPARPVGALAVALAVAAVPAASQATRHSGRQAPGSTMALRAAVLPVQATAAAPVAPQRPSRSAHRADAVPAGHHLGAPAALASARPLDKPAPPAPPPPAPPPPAGSQSANAPATQQSNPAPPPITVDGSAGSRILAVARKYVGYPYVYAGTSPSTGFDCSGYVTYVYRQAGVAELTPQSEAQLHEVRIIPRGAARPGDLIFYLDASGVSYHVAIYAGGNMEYAAATPEEGVVYEPIWDTNILFGTDWH